ncbi:MAG: hypothetical protein P4L26_02880 [Terracidiphilus sp.]|nr:hypothetical protein [Terracidiphilus sp.]
MPPGTSKAFNVVVGMAGGAVVSVFVFAILIRIFKAATPGCAAGQIDDPCGFAAFLHLAYSLMGAFLVWPIAGFMIARLLARRQEQKGAKTEPR